MLAGPDMRWRLLLHSRSRWVSFSFRTSFVIFTFLLVSSFFSLPHSKLLVYIQCTWARRLHGSHRAKLMEATLRSNVAVINWLEGFKYPTIFSLWWITCHFIDLHFSLLCVRFYSCFRCFCYSEKGDKIFGWEWWKDADNMTCKCSRQRYRAERSGRLDVTLHCLPNGNFEALQCDMGICWCADEQSGFIQPGTVAVPDNLWTFLPCCKF